jgi:hypothetical protein
MRTEGYDRRAVSMRPTVDVDCCVDLDANMLHLGELKSA